MIKITYEQKAYNYKHVGSQDYDMKAEMVLNEDITSVDAILALMKMLQIATYGVSGDTLREAASVWDMNY